MNKTKFYTVTGHTFCITMAESENVWQGMAPAYSPFEILPARQVLFVLTVGNFISPKEADLILRDSNLREEEASWMYIVLLVATCSKCALLLPTN